MNVVTLDSVSLEQKTIELWEDVIKKYVPEYVIAIERGGGVLVDVLLDAGLIDSACVIRLKSQRKLTQSKDKFFTSCIKILPDRLNVLLRQLESLFKESMQIFRRNNNPKYVSLLSNIDLKVLDDKNILIIDDAIDSGETILSCIQFLEQKCEPAELKIACITVTFTKPIIQPHFTLFNRTIVRFPWAPDVKN